MKSLLNNDFVKDLKDIFPIFIVSRIAILVIAVLTILMFFPGAHNSVLSLNFYLELFSRWDSGWYINIVDHGYTNTKYMLDQANYAFFPLLPLLVKGLNFITGNRTLLSGFLISNVSFLISLIYLKRLLKFDFEENISKKVILILIAFPTAFYFSCFLTESLFFALLITIFYYARKENWLVVGILGFLISLTRSIGVFVVIPILIEYFHSKNFDFRKIKLDILFLSSFLISFCLWLLFNKTLTGDYLAFMHIEESWNKGLKFAIKTFIDGLKKRELYVYISSIFSIFSLIVISINIKKIRISYLIFSILAIAIPLSGGIQSMQRYLIIVFPLYLSIVLLCEKRRLKLDMILIFFSMLQSFFIVAWVLQNVITA